MSKDAATEEKILYPTTYRLLDEISTSLEVSRNGSFRKLFIHNLI